MGREIKFRGWHTQQKKMYSARELADDQLTLLTTGEFINVHSVSTELSEIMPADKFIPLQFTGLKDKSGVEIYEGDIVREFYKIRHKQTGEEKETGFVDVVEWGHQPADYEQSYFWGWMLGSSGLRDGKDVTYSNSFWNCLEERYEVIGNIYENPELLK
jgi:uncharacterized phage protein (TIGR01671 family)